MTLIVTWLWQGLILAWAVAAAMRAMPRLNAATRHAVWWLALAAVLAIPAAHVLAGIAAAVAPLSDPARGDATVSGALLLPAIPAGVLASLAAIWAVIAAVGVLRIAISCRALGRLKRESSPFDGSREARLPLWVAARNSSHWGHRSAELRISDGISGACALGLGKPVILVSRAIAAALSDDSLDEIVMHEQAHLDRYDDWSQLLEAFVGSLAGLHPAVGFLMRRLDLDREAACDDRVVANTGAAGRYACALVAVAAASSHGVRGVEFGAAMSRATTTTSALRVRVRRILDPARARDARVTRAAMFVCVATLAAGVGLLTRVAPVAIFLETATVDVPIQAASLVIDAPSAPEPVPLADVSTTVGWPVHSPRTEPAQSSAPAPIAPTQSDAPVVLDPSIAETTEEAAPAKPLDSRALGTTNVPDLVPPTPPPATQSLASEAAAPWETIANSAVSTAGDVARTAVEAGARARKTGVSFGRFVTRVRQAGANVF